MTPRQVLIDTRNLLHDHHHTPDPQWLIAADKHGNRVRPISPEAVEFSVIGALCRIAPRHTPGVYADLTEAGEAARALLVEMAEHQGYLLLNEVDKAGLTAIELLFSMALTQCEPEPRRRLHAVAGTGSQPRGVA